MMKREGRLEENNEQIEEYALGRTIIISTGECSASGVIPSWPIRQPMDLISFHARWWDLVASSRWAECCTFIRRISITPTLNIKVTYSNNTRVTSLYRVAILYTRIRDSWLITYSPWIVVSEKTSTSRTVYMETKHLSFGIGWQNIVESFHDDIKNA